MKAIHCTACGLPEVLKLAEASKPVPGDTENLIKIHATAATASDAIVRGYKLPKSSVRGILMGLALGFKRPGNPILGMIVCGEVESAGKPVKRFRKPGNGPLAGGCRSRGIYQGRPFSYRGRVRTDPGCGGKVEKF